MRVVYERVMHGVDVAARSAWSVALLAGYVTSFFSGLEWLRPGFIIIILFSWAYNRWHDQLPWLGGISALPWAPSDAEVRAWNFWVKFWAATAIMLFILEALLPPVIDFTKVPLGIAGVCALMLSHLAILRDLAFEWRFTLMVAIITAVCVADAPEETSVLLVPLFATLGALSLRKVHLSRIGDVSYKPMLIAELNRGVEQ